MSVANLTRYKMMKLIDGAIMHPWGNDDSVEYVKFEEAMSASSNSLQQLKAEIAALVNKIEHNRNSVDFNIVNYLRELRQLSAV